MEPALFEVLGKAAGLAGIGIGLALLIFRQVISAAKPRGGLPPELAYRTFRTTIVATFSIGTIGICAWLIPRLLIPSAHSISGNIRDNVTNGALGGVQVVVAGHPVSTMSFSDGNYTLEFSNVPPKGKVLALFFTKSGYKTESLQAEVGDTNANKTLDPLPSPSLVPPRTGHSDTLNPVQTNQGPRTLTKEDASKIEQCLTNHPISNRTEVWFVGKNDDSWAYAHELFNALNGPLANESFNDSGNPMMPLAPVRDVAIRTRAQDDGATQLRDCLKEGGVEVHLDLDPLGAAQTPLLEGYLPRGKIDVVVGPRSSARGSSGT